MATLAASRKSLAPAPIGAAMTNIGGQPVQPPQIQAPNLPPSPTPQPLTYNPTQVGAAPTATSMGAFQAPTLPGGMDAYQFRVDQANKGAQRSAAARGTLLSGGFQTALAKLNQGLASEEVDKIYNRALSTYNTNRDTNQQNYGQSLAGYQAGTGAQLDAGRLNLAGQQGAYDRTYGAARDAHGDAVDAAQQQANVLNVNNQARSLYDQQMADYRASLDAQNAANVAQQNTEQARTQGTTAQTPLSERFVSPPRPARRGGFRLSARY
jgi:hypothetical protein